MAIQANNSDILSGTMCNMTFYNLTLQYRSGKYSLAGEPVLADPAFAAVMQSGLLSQLGNFQLVSSLQATRLAAQNQSSSLAAMNQELSRLSLALFAGTLQTAASTTQQSALFGRYPLAPVIVYLFFLYSYAFTAGGIYIWAARLRSPLFRAPGRKTTSAMQLAQLQPDGPPRARCDDVSLVRRLPRTGGPARDVHRGRDDVTPRDRHGRRGKCTPEIWGVQKDGAVVC
ncbi:hypothetical protein B0H11DRAFT_1236582 [Mycena galericulata]|nr:hypothetical protein B0H11DRAFT_1236582 [Mycena galericulata]